MTYVSQLARAWKLSEQLKHLPKSDVRRDGLNAELEAVEATFSPETDVWWRERDIDDLRALLRKHGHKV